MNMEGPLKSAKEIAMEKAEAMEGQEARKPLRSAKEIAMERAERMLAEAENKKKELEQIEKLAKEYDLDVSDTIAAKKAEISDIEAASGYREAGPEETGESFSQEPEIAKTKLENVAADNYREVTPEEIGAKEKQIRAESQENEPEKTLAEKNQEEIDKYFSREETTGVKNYDAQGKEVIDEARPQTLAEKNQAEINKYFSKEETTGVKTYDKEGNEIVSEYKAPEEAKNEVVKEPETEALKAEENAAKAEAVAEKAATAEERAKIQKEALEDFRRDLKKSPEAKKIDELVAKVWELRAKENAAKKEAKQESAIKERPGNVIDINSARKEKPSAAKEREKVLMEAVADFRKELKSKRKLAKMFEKILDLAGMGKKQVAEAGRIDRIMRGDRRSGEAVKVDEAAGRAFELGKAEKAEALSQKLKEAESVNDLMHALDKIETLTNEEGIEYSGSIQKNHIKNLFMTGNPEFLRYITRAEGLRENVKRVFDSETNKKKEYKKQAA